MYKRQPLLEALFDRTLKNHPGWWCRREQAGKRRDWKTFFVEFDYRDVTAMNREWERDAGSRFAKRRELLWVPADSLRELYAHSPDRLWKRLRQLVNVQQTIQSIKTRMLER